MSIISEIHVKKLFGRVDYTLPLNTTDNITIIHGPNGCGKTWILQLINSVFSSDYATLTTAPFQEIGFKFHDGGNFIIRKDFEERLPLFQSNYQRHFERTPQHKLYITYYSKRTKKPKEFSFPIGDRTFRGAFPQSIIERELPNLRRIGLNRWRDLSRGVSLSIDEIYRIYGHRLPPITRPLTVPDWLRVVTERISVDFIQSQRLIRIPASRERSEPTSQRDVTEMVDLDSVELGERIRRTLAESVKIAQLRDQTFPMRVIRSEFSQLIPEPQLRDELRKIEIKRQKLYSAGLLDKEEAVPLPEKKLSETEQKVLSLYLQDVTDKLHVFDDLQSRIATLMNLINTKIEPQGKTLIVDRDKGFLFKTTYGDTMTLRPADLSSGEQNLLVLLYELLFKATRRTLFLIDEPEISLNVEWQRRFLSDLSEVIQFGKHYVLLATHSPQIIHNRWDLAIPLGGGVSE